MKIRTMQRNDWNTVMTEKKYLIEPCTFRGKEGKISLIFMERVDKPFYADGKKLADTGYSWLQAALQGEYFWMTAMFDETGRFCEIYIDMTDGSRTDTEDPFFTDMYLDYVVTEEGIQELDREELDEAFKSGRITKEQYLRTISEGEKLKNFLTGHREEIFSLLRSEYERLRKKAEKI